jgi:hypothetical protein
MRSFRSHHCEQAAERYRIGPDHAEFFGTSGIGSPARRISTSWVGGAAAAAVTATTTTAPRRHTAVTAVEA